MFTIVGNDLEGTNTSNPTVGGSLTCVDNTPTIKGSEDTLLVPPPSGPRSEIRERI